MRCANVVSVPHGPQFFWSGIWFCFKDLHERTGNNNRPQPSAEERDYVRVVQVATTSAHSLPIETKQNEPEPCEF